MRQDVQPMVIKADNKEKNAKNQTVSQSSELSPVHQERSTKLRDHELNKAIFLLGQTNLVSDGRIGYTKAEAEEVVEVLHRPIEGGMVATRLKVEVVEYIVDNINNEIWH